MGEPITFRSIASSIKLARIVCTAPQGTESRMAAIADFVDALMAHLEWPDDLWTTLQTPRSWFETNPPFLGVTLDLKTCSGDAPIRIVLKFQADGNLIKLVSHDGKSFSATFSSSTYRTKQDPEALNNAGQALLDAAKAAVSK